MLTNFGGRSSLLQNEFGKLAHGEFNRIAQIDRPGEGWRTIHQAHQAIDEVADETKRAGLVAVAVQRDRLAGQRLNDEIGDHAAVGAVHAGSVGVENTRDLDFKPGLAVVVKEQGFSAAFALVVTGTGADGIDMSPVVLGLRMNRGVAVDLAG